MSESKRAQEARERAEEYKARYGRPQETTRETEQPPGLRTPHDLDHWNDIVGQRIEEAMRQGYFDNLAGHGKPLDLSKNPFVPDDMQMANKLMENNSLTPGWIGDRKSILQAIEAYKDELVVGHAAYTNARSEAATAEEAAAVEEMWQRQLEAWRDKLRILNRRIEAVHIIQPAQHLEIFKLVLERELETAKRSTKIED